MKTILVFVSTLLPSLSAFAGTAQQPAAVPVLDSWGLVAISAVLGVAGLIAMKRK